MGAVKVTHNNNLVNLQVPGTIQNNAEFVPPGIRLVLRAKPGAVGTLSIVSQSSLAYQTSAKSGIWVTIKCKTKGNLVAWTSTTIKRPPGSGDERCQYATEAFGGNGGKDFTDPVSIIANFSALHVRSGKVIDQIFLELYDESGSYTTPAHGGKGGSSSVFKVAKDEWITTITVYAGKLVNALQFTTSKGSRSPTFGRVNGDQHFIFLPSWDSNGRADIVALYGRSGKKVDRLGFIFTAKCDLKSRDYRQLDKTDSLYVHGL